MFSSGPNYTKLKTNLRLAQNRLKLLEKKKAELTQKARKEIGDYLATGKIERARIRVEHIIREDYLVEAMEIIEMYCDLLLARFGLVTQMKMLDDGIAEPVSSLVWVCPRLQSDVVELKVISDIFIQKYGPEFAEHARTATGDHHVSEKVMHKLQLQAPPKLLVEKYLIEIAKNYNIEYEPDPQVMGGDSNEGQDQSLIDLSDRNNLGGGSAPGEPPQMGFIGYPTIPPLPTMPEPPSNKPFNYPPPDYKPYNYPPPDNKPFNYPPPDNKPFNYPPPDNKPFNYPPPDNKPSNYPPPDNKPFNYPPPNKPFNYPAYGDNGGGAAAGSDSSGGGACGPPPFAYNIPPNIQPTSPQQSPSSNEKKDLNTNFIDEESSSYPAKSCSGDNGSSDENILRPKMHNDPPPRYSSINPNNLQNSNKPKPQPRSKLPPAPGPSAPAYPDIPNLPNVPNDLPDIPNDGMSKPPGNEEEIDFDDLSRRFENLKKRK